MVIRAIAHQTNRNRGRKNTHFRSAILARALHAAAFRVYFMHVMSHGRKITAIVSRLLEWYSRNARDLPWRQTNDPYAVFVSEIMLQQTQVKTVLPYWRRWMRALPTIETLARAKASRIHKLWEGLGYYTRVRNMQKAAQRVLDEHGGRFPSRFEEVLALPGIGRYTAGAICSIAFNQPTPILDGNVIRVLARVFGVAGDPRDKLVNARLWQIAEDLVRQAGRLEHHQQCVLRSRRRPGSTARTCSHLNQSLMELGALVCTPRQPHCADCPLARQCVALRTRRVDLLPERPPRPSVTLRRFAAFVVRRNGKHLVRQRPAGIVNGHLWEFPNIEVDAPDLDPTDAARRLLGAAPARIRLLFRLKHSITRYRIELDVYEADVAEQVRLDPKAGCWRAAAQLRSLAFTAAHKKILRDLDAAGATQVEDRG